jgi:hypothetical protein
MFNGFEGHAAQGVSRFGVEDLNPQGHLRRASTSLEIDEEKAKGVRTGERLGHHHPAL